MHSHSIKNLWDLPELKIIATNKINHQIFLDVMPIKLKQACPICASENTSRRGIGYVRKVRHLEVFGCPVFIEWYDCICTYELAKKSFERWLGQGAIIKHPAIESCLSTMRNWQEEICNYHKLRFTNAAVEGKNNLIKALQRRHFFTRNPQHYKETILLECNAEWIQYGS